MLRACLLKKIPKVVGNDTCQVQNVCLYMLTFHMQSCAWWVKNQLANQDFQLHFTSVSATFQ